MSPGFKITLRASCVLLGDVLRASVAEARQRLISHSLKERALVGRNRIAAPTLESELGITSDAVDADLEVKMRARRPASHPHKADGTSHGDTGTGVHSRREVPHVAVAADHAVPMANVDHVAVAALLARENHDAVTDCADGRTHRGCVVRSGVIAPFTEDRMLARSENAADAAKRDGRAEEGRTQRHTAGLIVLGAGGAMRIEVNGLKRVVAVRQRQTGANDLVDDDRAVGLLQPL